MKEKINYLLYSQLKCLNNKLQILSHVNHFDYQEFNFASKADFSNIKKFKFPYISINI